MSRKPAPVLQKVPDDVTWTILGMKQFYSPIRLRPHKPLRWPLVTLLFFYPLIGWSEQNLFWTAAVAVCGKVTSCYIEYIFSIILTLPIICRAIVLVFRGGLSPCRRPRDYIHFLPLIKDNFTLRYVSFFCWLTLRLQHGRSIFSWNDHSTLFKTTVSIYFNFSQASIFFNE